MPVLTGTLAWFVCELELEHEGGDHAILIGSPLEGAAAHGRPLVFYGRGFHEPPLAGP